MTYPDTYSKEEQLEIDRRFKLLLDKWNMRENDTDIEIVTKAFEFAVMAHKDTRRRSGEPYMYHPLAVATIVAVEIGMGKISIVSAFLHDVVEDTEYTLNDIKERFGEKVAHVVDGLTKLNKIDFQTDIESLQAENFRKIVNTLSDEVRVVFIKLADRLHNMRTLDSMPHHKQLKIASETSFFYAPLAYRLGLYAIKTELEDLCLKYINPQIYESVKKQLNEIRENKMKEMEDFILPVKLELEKMGLKVKTKILERTVSGIYERMQKYEQSLDEIYDVFVARFIIDCPIELEKIKCWEVFAVLTMFYRPNNTKLRDWVSFPKTNGYESIHAVFMSKMGNWIETQIRTTKMEEIAERGFVAYWKYRNNFNIGAESGFEVWLNRIRNLISSDTSSALDFLNSFKLDLFNDEIFVFTPKGDMICLPKDSTVLDFAYTIHSQIGNHCIGANVNKRLQKMDYVLKMGDQVEVITSEYQCPKEKWFDFLATSTAKSRLKTGLKDYRRTFKEKGKHKLSEIFKKMNIDFSKQNRNYIVEKKHLSSRIDLYYYVAIDKLTYKEIDALFKKKTNISQHLLKYLTFGLAKPLQKENNSEKEAINDEKMDYTISTCCNPIPGDDVVAIAFPNQPVQIHKSDCSTAINLMTRYGQNIVKAKWQLSDTFAFMASLKILGINEMGFGNMLFSVLSDKMKLDIYSIQMESEGGIVEVVISFHVNNLKQLEEIIERIKKIDLVKKVSRIERNPNN